MIPVCRPILPTADKLAPYLARIDESRYYSNFGPLCREYEERLSNHFGGYVVATSSGTQALLASLIAWGFPPRSFIACPSFTFVATPATIVSAGHIPYFVDIDPETWIVNEISSGIPCGLIGVSPFGAPVPDRFHIIDAAAGFDTVVARSTPTIVSTHATKPFSTGEGGFVLSKNKHLIDEIRIVINHGISPDRSVSTCGINGKMSEYHAAVGLAELDGWSEKREKWLQLAEWYARPSWAASTHIVKTKEPAKIVAERLKERGIDSRLCWYGCHQQPAYAGFPRTHMTATESLMEHTMALPMYIGMTKENVNFVLEKLDA